MATVNKTVTFNTSGKEVAVTKSSDSYVQLFNSSEEGKLKNVVPRYSSISKADLTLEVADEHTLASGYYNIIYGPYGTERYSTAGEYEYTNHVFSILSGVETGGSYAGYPQQRTEGVSGRFLGLKIRDKVLGTHTNIWIRNFKIDYTFTYPTYCINAEVKAMSDGISNTMPGKVVVVTDSGYTSFTLNSKFDVDQTSKKYGIRAEPNYGFKFSKWEDTDTSNTKTWTISDSSINSHTTQTSTQRPIFIREKYTISSPTTTGGKVTGAGSYEYEKKVSLTATADYGYHFVKWEEDSNTSATREVTVTKNQTFTPVFAKNTYKITANSESLDKGRVSGGKTYTHGDTVTLTATPEEGYCLLGWKKGANGALVLNLPNNNNEKEVVNNHEEYSYNKIQFSAKEAATYTAYFIEVQVTYDSIFSFPKWRISGIASEKASTSDFTSQGFTLTCIDPDGDGYSKSSLTIPVEKGQSYTFECNVEGKNFEFFVFNCPTRYNNSWENYNGTKYKYSTKKKFSFTPQTDYICIRCDANGKGNAVKFSNFRIYPSWDDFNYLSTTLGGPYRADSGNWSVPKPGRRGHKFLGWNTQLTHSGEDVPYFSPSDLEKDEIEKPFPAEDLVLYSHWEDTSKVVFRVTYANKNTILT